MSLKDTIARDYLIFDEREAVTLKVRNHGSPDTFTDYALASVLVLPTTREEKAEAGILTDEETLSFSVFTPELTAASAPAPKPTDGIQLGGDTYWLRTAERKVFGQTFTCLGVKAPV